MSLETRLVQDLGLVGDDLMDAMEILTDEFGVDLSRFDSRMYSPPEGDLLFPNTLLNYLRGRTRKLDSFPPLTLKMILQAIKLRRWPPEG
jgi:hypothetical protein